MRRPASRRSCRGLQQLGWTDGRNVRIDTRWAAGNADDIRKYAAELVALAPDVILAPGSDRPWRPLLQATRTVPIVFAVVADPVGAGFVDSLARPGGNATGFIDVRIQPEREMAGAAQADRAGRDAGGGPSGSRHAAGIGQFGAIQAVAPSLGVELSPIDVRDAGEIERAIAAFARALEWRPDRDGERVGAAHRDLIITLAARHKLPAVYSDRFFVADGGLISYGPDFVDQYRRAAGYVDRILKGEKPADLPVQAPTKYRAGDQPQDRQGARPRSAAVAARPRRRGDRMSAPGKAGAIQPVEVRPK